MQWERKKLWNMKTTLYQYVFYVVTKQVVILGTYQFTYEVKWLPGVVYQIMRHGQYLLSWKLKNGISLIPICWLIWRLNSWGKQAIFNLGIKKKSGLSINPGIHHTKVFSSVRIWRNCVFAANSNFQIATCRWCKLLIFQT